MAGLSDSLIEALIRPFSNSSLEIRSIASMESKCLCSQLKSDDSDCIRERIGRRPVLRGLPGGNHIFEGSTINAGEGCEFSLLLDPASSTPN